MFGFLLFIIYFSIVSIFLIQGRQWWVRIETESPNCTYYFGPFESQDEAQANHKDYLYDLHGEGAQGIRYVIEQCYPRQLTIVRGERN